MKHLLNRIWTEQSGALSFEWTLLATLVGIGIVGGITAARDAIIDELADVAQVMLAVDQSYRVGFPLQVEAHTAGASSSSDSQFTDAMLFTDCARSFEPLGQEDFLLQNTDDVDS